MDEVPIVDTLPGAENMLIGCGWSGHGFAISLAVAKLLAAWAYDGERPALLEPSPMGVSCQYTHLEG